VILESVAYCPYCDRYSSVDEMLVGVRDISFKLSCGHETRLTYPYYSWYKSRRLRKDDSRESHETGSL